MALGRAVTTLFCHQHFLNAHFTSPRQSTYIFPLGEGGDNGARDLIGSQIGTLALSLLRILFACSPALSTVWWCRFGEAQE